MERLERGYEVQRKHLKESIATLKNAALALRPDYDLTKKVTPGEFRGLEIKSAMQAYLSQRGGGPVKRDRIAVDLAIAGVDLGTPKRHARHIKITANNNKSLFFYDEDTDTVRLVRSATAAKPPTRARKAPAR